MGTLPTLVRKHSSYGDNLERSLDQVFTVRLVLFLITGMVDLWLYINNQCYFNYSRTTIIQRWWGGGARIIKNHR